MVEEVKQICREKPGLSRKIEPGRCAQQCQFECLNCVRIYGDSNTEFGHKSGKDLLPGSAAEERSFARLDGVLCGAL